MCDVVKARRMTCTCLSGSCLRSSLSASYKLYFWSVARVCTRLKSPLRLSPQELFCEPAAPFCDYFLNFSRGWVINVVIMLHIPTRSRRKQQAPRRLGRGVFSLQAFGSPSKRTAKPAGGVATLRGAVYACTTRGAADARASALCAPWRVALGRTRW